MSKQQRKFNFSAGPAMLPHEVHEQILAEWYDWNGMEVPLVEVSHRSEKFLALMEKLENDMREIMSIPNNYHVLFLHGGGQMQFSAVPLNLMGKNNKADYLVYGHWSHLACEEVKHYGQVQEVNLLTKEKPLSLISEKEWSLNPDTAYTYYCSNETIAGIALPFIPTSKAPLVVDMSSDILSKPVDVSKFGVIFACTQKNMGVPGLAVVIVRDDLLDQAMPWVPSVINYKKQVEAGSVLNTANTFACYVTSLVLDWTRKQGGLKAMQITNERKAKKLYDYIDQSKFYINQVAPAFRSMMNACFFLPSPELEQVFLEQAHARGLLYLRGHKVSGGIRASIYNAMPEEGVDHLIEFMKVFAAQGMQETPILLRKTTNC